MAGGRILLHRNRSTGWVFLALGYLKFLTSVLGENLMSLILDYLVPLVDLSDIDYEEVVNLIQMLQSEW
jgi:hypothetical protein